MKARGLNRLGAFLCTAALSIAADHQREESGGSMPDCQAVV
jgi:hypothetical protein